ncbi:MAG TPA: TetR/AcrR family transcriptional regulator [Actinomycetota bacterium]
MKDAAAVKGTNRQDRAGQDRDGGDGNRPALTARGERTRAKLLESAEAVFAERSFDEASIVQITQRAGVAMGTFYLYFPSKQAVFSELVRDLGHRLRVEIAQAIEGLERRTHIEREGFRAFFEFTRRHPGLYRIIRSAESVDRDVFEEHYERLAEGYVEGLSTAMDTGEFRQQDPMVLAYLLMGIAEMVGMRWILWRPEGQVSDELLEQLIAFIRHGAAAEPPDAPRTR